MSLKFAGSGFASAVVVIAAAVWGLYWIPLRLLQEQGVAGDSAVALLHIPALLPLMLVVALQWKLHRGHWGKILLIGLFTGLGIALYSSGVVYSSVVRATLLFYLTPVWATIIEILWFKEKADWSRWLAVAGGLAGMALMLSGNESVQLNIGDLLALLSGIFWAIGAAMIKRFDTVPIAGLALGQFAFTVFTVLLIGSLMGSESHFQITQVVSVLPVISLISILIFLPVVLAIIWAQKFINPGRVGLLMMSEVLVAVVSASLLLPQERMTIIEYCGAALIIGACLFEVLSTPKPKELLASC